VLPAAEGSFEKLFIVEDIEGVDAIYKATNGAGYVCLVGEQFIATDATGKALSEESSVVESAMEKILATETTAIVLEDYEGLPSQLISADRTLTGNYIITIKGAGYGITGGDVYHPASGEYIIIRVSMTADGKILDCLTVSEEETDGIGSACADEDFYGQFVGKTEETYQDIDAISGATLTTDGYKKAILRAFTCVEIFEGGVEN
jgi:Na+-translocating ferredoxin:NAD+ oxidoreductase RnfG subunit